MNKSFKIQDFCNLRTPILNNDILQSNILENIGEYLTFKKANGLYDNSYDYSSTDFKKNAKFKFKTNGIKAYLYFTIQNNKYHSYLIEQLTKSNKINIICTRFRVHPDVYKNTLLYGELVYKKDEKWGFYIEDVILLNNKPSNFMECNLDKIYKKDEIIEICSMYKTKYYSLEELQKIDINHILNLDYQVIGLEVFYNDAQHILYFNNIDSSSNIIEKEDTKTIKFNNVKKYQFKITKDIKLPDIYYLYKKNDSGFDSRYEIAYIPTLDLSKKIRKIFTDKEEAIIECEYSNKFNKWVPCL